jgi:predicted anti-sigma-YlaC factor YlaD
MHLAFRRSDRTRDPGIGCVEIREAISARFDNEPAPTSDKVTARHLSDCRSCRDFESGIAELGRPARLRSAASVPPSLLPLLRQHHTPSTGGAPVTRRRHSPQWPRLGRWALAAAPAAAAIVALPLGLAAGHTHHAPSLTLTPCNAYIITHHQWSGYAGRN